MTGSKRNVFFSQRLAWKAPSPKRTLKNLIPIGMIFFSKTGLKSSSPILVILKSFFALGLKNHTVCRTNVMGRNFIFPFNWAAAYFVGSISIRTAGKWILLLFEFLISPFLYFLSSFLYTIILFSFHVIFYRLLFSYKNISWLHVKIFRKAEDLNTLFCFSTTSDIYYL